ncbi:MAG: hypothetical protein IJ602_02290 [Paludibacteraceae bacterium]|nr:hypothetical protein [Paludibacteraceae bacterium]
MTTFERAERLNAALDKNYKRNDTRRNWSVTIDPVFPQTIELHLNEPNGLSARTLAAFLLKKDPAAKAVHWITGGMYYTRETLRRARI